MLRTELIRPLPEMLAEHARHRGESPAFADSRRRVTYAELEARTRRIAGHLAGLRVQPGDRVAIYLGNRVEAVESYLAITRASAIGVPLNPHSTEGELAYFLADSGARVVITDPAHADQVAAVRGTDRYPTIVVTEVHNPPAGTVAFEAIATTEPDTPARDDLDLDDVAWMLYTSGTTGRPKGVLSTQRNCLWSVAACYVPVPDLTPQDRVLWPLPLFHSLSHIACVLAVTAVGASARITEGYSADEILDALRTESATYLAGVPAMYHYLVQAARQHGVTAPGLRVGLVGGAVTTAALRQAVEDTFGVPLLDAYGSTETCGSIAINWPSGARVEGSCGLPVPGLNVRLVDPETERDVPAGVEGEVWVSGPSVMAGYHNRPEETAAALRGGWYRTGDLARRDDAGYLTVCGRIKDLIIRGGENLHPGEVEEVVRTVPGVVDVAVAGKPHEVLGEVVVAYVVPGPGGVDADAVFAACRQRLAPFKVPDELYEVADIPRTRSGKVTRHVLLDVPARLRAVGTGYYENLLRPDWVAVPAREGAPDGEVTVLRAPAAEDGSALAEVRAGVRSWLSEREAGRLVVVTRGAVAAGPGELPDPAQAAVAGFVLGMRARHGERVVLLDVATNSESDVDDSLLATALADGGARFAVREGVVLRPVLTRLPAGGDAVRLDPERPAVIVGAGTPAGAAIARHLVTGHGARHVLLLAERGQGDPVLAELAEELPTLSPGRRVSVRVVACDIGDRSALTRVLSRAAGSPSIVVYAANTAVQAAGVPHLATVHGNTPLLLVSDAAATLERAGEPEAAAVGGLFDAYAVRGRTADRPVVSLSLGPWAEDGTTSPTELPAGVGTLSRRELFAAVDSALLAGEPAVVSVRLDTHPPSAGVVPAPLRDVLEAPQGGGASVAPSADRVAALRAELAGLPAADRLWTLVDLVRAAVTDVRADGAGDQDRAFREIGFTSMQAVQLRNRLVELTGLTLPVTLVFDHPTPRSVAEHVLAQLTGDQAEDTVVARRTTDAEPVAIVGMACRLPGGIGSPEDLWTFLVGEGDGIGPFPADRGWDLDGIYDPDPEHAGTTYVRDGGFLADAAGFDADFFGISPREALSMDPQQRLFLETAWEAFERAGIDVASLRGSKTGVFAGVMNQEYGAALAAAADDTEGYRSTGASVSVVSGRVAYSFGFEGPAVTLDTACSSSLVALHLASDSLRSGESDLALAGGVAVMASPSSFVEFSRQRGLATDGRCKAFAAGADGTGWSEGVSVIVLERLSDAQRNGHGVLAVVRGSAVNSDGASNGLTAPNGLSQQRVIRQALANAGLRPSDVDTIEAHGTGTTLGDPIEAQALINAYGPDRDRPLWLGSLKSNIGHTQAAAGVAGVIKTVLAMRNGVLPKTLHVDAPTPHVDWSAGAVELLTEAQSWPDTDRPRRAGVSAFGVSGTNAHVIIEQAPEASPASAAQVEPENGVVPWILSARSPAALAASAERLAAHVADHPDLAEFDVAALLARRARLPYGAVVVGADRDALARGVAAVAAGIPDPSVVSGEAGVEGRMVFVFPGQGTQWVGMGAGLLESSPVFADAVAECEAALSSYVDWSVVDVIRRLPGAPSLDRVDVVQPVSFVMMVALARLWQHHGVRPDAVLGHSQGEIAAAHIAGVLSLDDAARVVALRSQAIARRLAGRGAMMSVALPVEAVEERLSSFVGAVEVATVNGPASVVVAGDPDAVEELRVLLDGDGVRARTIAVDYASHTSHVELIEDELAELLAAVSPRTPDIPMWSTTDSAWVDGPALGGEYWYRNLRHTVRFQKGIDTLTEAAYRLFVEVSAHPVLSAAIEDSLADRSGALVVPTLRRDQHEPTMFSTALATLQVHTDQPVDWHLPTATPDHDHPLPTYAFQHQRYWPQAKPPATAAASSIDGRFWDVIEQGDAASLADLLKAGADTRDAFTSVLPLLAGWRRRAGTGAAIDSWRYRVTWRRLGVVASERMSGRWLAVLPASAAGDERVTAVLDVLRSRGADVVPFEVPATGGGLAEALAGEVTDVRGVLSFLAMDESPHTTFPAVPNGLAQLAELLPALVDSGVTAPVWAFTAGATGAGDDVVRPVQALTWGLGLVAALEYPRTWGGLIDLPAEPDDKALQHLPAVLLGQGDEDQLALRASGVLGRRLVHAPFGDATPHHTWTPRGTVLITGGTGGVGGQVARWLAAHGAEHLLLLGRRGRDADGVAELEAELTALGAAVTVAACDVSARDDVAAAVASIPDDRPLTAVVHAAGVGQRDQPIAETDPAELARTLAGKVAGARNLDDVLGDRQLDAFVLLSSNAGVWGGGGQGAYAAANAYLDALAARRRQLGRTATGIAWGSWGGAGLGAVDGAAEKLRTLGLPAMDPDLAVAALVAAVEHDETTVSVADVDWARFAPGFTAARPSALLRELPEAQAALRDQDADLTTETGADWAARLGELAESDRERVVLAAVQANAAAVLGHADPSAVDPNKAFTEQGFDSMTAVQLRNHLVKEFGLRLPTTLLFDHPSARALAGHLVSELSGVAADVAPTAATTTADDEPIAIVGMACRLPGGIDSPEDLWALLVAGGETLSDFPADRGWDVDGIYDPEPGLPGKTYTRRGGFLDTATEFDPAFFGISPREALGMDPQHRVFLEAAWESLERAGIDVTSLRGSRTGVFAGGFHTGYTIGADLIGAGVDGYTSHNNLPSVLSGRVAYTFGFEGPAVTVDTACSSSLVAMHMASASLRSGESDLALAGGVAVMARPSTFVEFSRQRGLATDGRCKAFAAGADGTGWSEGVSVLVLERLSDARRNGHGVLALVRGSAVNSDGASNGLTAPNGLSQQRVIRQALANADLRPSDVDTVEAHGTGTTLGDPIEAQALINAYGDRDQPLWLGSLKSNIGHAQAAAGAAGVIKTVLAIRNGVLPKTLHVDAPTPHVDWSAGAVELLTEAQPWPDTDRPRRAAISAFGVSGTNAHVIIEQALEAAPVSDVDTAQSTVLPWIVSAKSPAALAEAAERLATHVADRPELAVSEVAAGLNARARHEHRAVVVGGDRDELLRGLRAVSGGEPDPAVVSGAVGVEGRTVFVFPGQGTQWVGMGAGLLESSPVFAEAVAECDAALSSYVDWSVADVIGQVPGAASLDRVDVVQPASFVMMVCLARMWQHHGVRPDAVLGHSQGEIAAAHIAGALSLDDAARVVALRSQAIASRLAGFGAMMSVALPVDEVEACLHSFASGLEIATINGPESVVVAGDPAVVEKLRAQLDGDGVRARTIAVDYASHTSHVELIEDELAELLAAVSPRTPDIPMWSTTDSAWVDGPALGGEYWYRNLRHTVHFHAAVDALAGHDHRIFVEVSSHPVLTAAIEGTLAGRPDTLVASTLRRNQHEPTTFQAALANVHVHTDLPVDWHLPSTTTDIDHPLPTYPFQHQRYWLDTGGTSDLGAVGLSASGHPLLGAAVPLPADGGVVFTNRISVRTQPWLAEHAVAGTVLLPGTALLELAVRAGDEVGAGVVSELVIEAPLTLPEHGALDLRVTVGALDDTGRRPVAVHSQTPDGHSETRHASGSLTGDVASPPTSTSWPPAGADPVDTDDFYPRQRDAGLELGPLFRGLRTVWTRGDEVFAEVGLPDDADRTDGFLLHPALLDAALHAAAYLPGRGGAGAAARLPFAWTGATFHATGSTALRVHLRASGDADVSVELTDATGGPVASIESLSTRAVDLDEVVTRGADLLYRLDWVPVTVPDTMQDDAVDDAVLDLTGTPDGSAPERARALVCHALDAVQRHLADAEPDRRLVVLTRHADHDPAMAAVWGLVRTAQSEHPGRFVVVDTAADTEAALLKSALATDEPQLALHDGAVTAPRLTRHEPTSPSRPLDPAGTVLVTGGTGMLGGLVARRLVTHHEVRHLLLTSRRGEQAPGADRLREELTALGAEVTVAACDLGDRAAVAALLDDVPAEHPLTAVIHSAAVLDDGVVTALDAERVARVFHPKVDGAWYLHEQTQHLDLAAFVLFSSASGTLGNAGQGNYAAANGFLDGLARHRRAAGLPASSLAWGLWERASELTGALLDGSRGHLKQDVAAMTDEEGMRLLDAVLARPNDPAVLVPIKLDLAAMRRSANPPSVVRGLLPAARPTARRTAEQATTTESFVDELRRLTPQRRLDRLVDTVRAYAAATLGHTDHAAIEERQSFRDLGVDSLAAVDLRNRLGAATGLRLPVTLAFDHPDPVALAGHLRDELGLADDGADDTAGESAASIAALAEIDRLEAALEDLLGRDAEDDAAAEAADRLRRLAARWRGGVKPDPEVVTDDDIIRLAEAELDRF